MQALRRSPRRPHVLAAPGNAGIAAEAEILSGASDSLIARVSLSRMAIDSANDPSSRMHTSSFAAPARKAAASITGVPSVARYRIALLFFVILYHSPAKILTCDDSSLPL